MLERGGLVLCSYSLGGLSCEYLLLHPFDLCYRSLRIRTDRCRYVAMHAMESVNAHTPMEYTHGVSDVADFNEPSLAPYAASKPQKRGLEIALVVVGMMLPLLTQIGHAHAHGG
jgi:hypothetical protein